jgi:mycoredoxin
MSMEETPRIMFYGTAWCGASRRVRLLLDSHSIPYDYIDIDLDREAAKRLEELNHGYRSEPTLVWPDGTTLVEPSNDKLAEKLGIKS